MASNHFDDQGNVHMVDVSGKPDTHRVATAASEIVMNAAAAATVRQGSGRKGDVLAVARIAAIGATKWTAHLIPLCHAIPIESVKVDFQWLPSDPQTADGPESDPIEHRLQCRVTCRTTGKTGIEMEAMTGASLGTLAIYDMLKSVDRQMRIGPTRLLEKRGGASGDFLASPS
ncbi:cyclic pyranopterin monophosphate synthase MoaC [Roseiconus nitratireducens]|uniref:cyclic pyranopterin monophosphate synthase n=1 Tax=Roseiconus nitratireducens TaxID=2605748 RepID=A0A5M6CYY2_9BACT|nr:cyclic pyranopterin monophosphate synthase MoaC [Roseiconus nitratireducens]KAA5540437.1 cyclic pyranopterin monophosphate synthase MoaC [Roseiconus nitratireducens]